MDLEGGIALKMRRQSVNLGVNLRSGAGDAPKRHVLELDELSNV